MTVDLEKYAKEYGVKFFLMNFTDLFGTQRSKLVPATAIAGTNLEQSDVFPIFQHPGLEFIYMLEGEVVYRHGGKTYTLRPGDSLFFDAEAPHGPEELRKLPIRFLSVISYTRSER